MAKSGWFKESARHSLAAKGVPTGRKGNYILATTDAGKKVFVEPIEPYTMIRMSELMRKNEDAGQHWFDEDTMSFFKSYVGGYAYTKHGDDKTAYFVSSEKSPYDARKWTIRRMNMADGHVLAEPYEKGTDFEFQKFTTQKSAEKRLMEILKG